MDYRLGAAATAAGHRLVVHDSLGSTNTEALERARSGQAGPLWVVARRQEAGRGRRGNAWTSPPGNLAASLLLGVDDVDPGRLATLGFVAGVALVDAVRVVCGDARTCVSADATPRDEVEGWGATEVGGPRLKWPNDVLLDGGKLAGILLEAETLRDGRRIVVVGFGVNVAAAPEGLPYAATCLRQAGCVVDAPDVLRALSDTIVAAMRLWHQGEGFGHVRARWLASAAGLGRPVSVSLGTSRVQGIFETIDDAGRLVVVSDDGTRRTVTAGEVHFGTAATAA
ncbi:biotin--[acetyl-CoA-carboxylase] ligase [Methylobacterium sp. Leaf466]|uniref:biotin--[acetyl-CoA-carboxylase] ligase n=1 Tax=Methylobacterium sp. Leaf466 TaxID=1736386 RepID=UPI0006F4AF0D|nr:biotin--[acetyl-CoA-carboxylase] ligase [Methylobacterium sp. Leaf466]KQT78120.1 biotin--[acetyl-CoA-carboxylase] ligase [Methylobacterium sp. Leaf466]